MMTLHTPAGDFGPFRNIEQADDHWICDGVVYHSSVVGAATIEAGAPDIPPPAPPVPQEVPMLNAHLVLIHDGKLDMLWAAVAALDEVPRQEVTAYFNIAQTCHRDNYWVNQLGPVLGYDSAGLDQLFIAADALNP